MAHTILPIAIADVAGKAIQNGGEVRLHGFILTETAGHDCVLNFRSPVSKPPGTANPPLIGSAIRFSRKIAASTDLAAFWSEAGILYPNGLFLDETGSNAVLLGDIFVS